MGIPIWCYITTERPLSSVVTVQQKCPWAVIWGRECLPFLPHLHPIGPGCLTWSWRTQIRRKCRRICLTDCTELPRFLLCRLESQSGSRNLSRWRLKSWGLQDRGLTQSERRQDYSEGTEDTWTDDVRQRHLNRGSTLLFHRHCQVPWRTTFRWIWTLPQWSPKRPQRSLPHRCLLLQVRQRLTLSRQPEAVLLWKRPQNLIFNVGSVVW